MNIKKKHGPGETRSKLILSIEENGFYREYYQVFNLKGLHLFMLNEFTTTWEQDYFTVYFNWNHLITKLNCFESKSWLPIKNTWWSYCPNGFILIRYLLKIIIGHLLIMNFINPMMEYVKLIYLKQKKSGLKYG